ncbi:MAG: Eco57I restriction-modification methylase domain-containing protein, partial [Candidatus Poribacteria bacterium]|nr:Eco57I restriction-modification methylase domain-containing protein [Candidatus Poribacteria bacterium]
FYRDLEEWYEWAASAETCKFPDKKNKKQVIRMITRLLFIWFLKEKNLVSSDLFEEEGARTYLKNFDFETSDYYQAILQNLFFATLNTPIPERAFREPNDSDDTDTPTTEKSPRPVYNKDHRNSNKYRYADLLQDRDAFLEHLKQVPFVNGGLFDSLDSFKGQKAGGKRVDCFTDWKPHRQKLHVPAKLFFQKEKGLYEIFSCYKFTVEENTPVEQEVALDPELLGQVFENLLGVYNPESETAARKTTGSYYTPRQIVDYMVDEALIAYFVQKVKPYDNDKKYLEDRLRDDLLAYHQLGEIGKPKDHLIHENEIEPMIDAIDRLEILDPAVGSGAFPMGILNKLVLILKKLDPENRLWKARQVAQAENIPDPQSREVALAGIDAVFSEANQYNNYGRKLYLIQNCIYGVDIQPIAVTIAKLRFFISLVIEQKSDADAAKNYGIRPLPNLETKLVAANTLIGLNELRQPDLQLLLENDLIQQLRQEIENICVKYFSESNRQVKMKYIDDEDRCREQLAKVLATQHTEWCKREENKISEQVAQIPKEKAQKQLREKLEKAYKVREMKLTAGVAEAQRIANWKRYDQNDKANFFDPEWMFGVTDGFDITIGNPPYVRADAGGDDPILRQKNAEMRKEIKDCKQYETLYEKWDLFIPFIERSYQLLKPNGFTTLIVSDAYCHAKYALKSQEWFLQNSKILRLDFLGKIQIFDAAVKNVIYLFQHAEGNDNKPERRVHAPIFGAVDFLPTDEQQNLTQRAFFPEDTVAQQFAVPTITLDNICYISYGLRPNSNPQDKVKFVTSDVVSDKKDRIHSKPFVEGKHLERWLPKTNLWIEWNTDRAPTKFYRPTFPEMYTVDEKILIQRLPGPNLKACYDDQQLVFTPSSVGFIFWHNLSGIHNRSIQKQTRYRDEKPKPDFPKREELEKISHRFAMKFLLGVMNSVTARDFLRANRRSNISLYPDDWKQLPIPDVPPEQQAPVVELVDKILDAKRKGLERKVARLEKKLDKAVSALYGVEN